jgi:hypothetical protein
MAWFEDPRENYNMAAYSGHEAVESMIRIYGSYERYYKSLPRRYFKATGSGYVSRDRKHYFLSEYR